MLGIDGTTCFGGESVPEARFFVATALRASGLIDMVGRPRFGNQFMKKRSVG